MALLGFWRSCCGLAPDWACAVIAMTGKASRMARTAKVPSVVATAIFFVLVFIFGRPLERVQSIYWGGRKRQDFASRRMVQKFKQLLACEAVSWPWGRSSFSS